VWGFVGVLREIVSFWRMRLTVLPVGEGFCIQRNF
jgi:hypothetical protein